MYIRGLKKEVGFLILKLIILLLVMVGIIIKIVFTVSEDTEEKNFKNESKELMKDIRSICNEDILSGRYHISTYTVNDGKINNIEKSYPSIKSGNISVDDKCTLSMLIFSDNYMAYKNSNNLLYVDRKTHNKCTFEEIEIGKEVKCLKEEFYIIDFDDKYITLLSKYNIDPKFSLQDKNNSIKVSFDKENNRNKVNNTYCSNSLYGCNVYDRYDGIFRNGSLSGTVNEESSIKYYVDSYAYKMNLEGFVSASLIGIDQLKKLGCDLNKKTCTNTDYDFIYSTSYWSKDYYEGSNSLVYQILSDGTVSTNYALYDNYLGIRPVLKIQRY